LLEDMLKWISKTGVVAKGFGAVGEK